MIHRFGKSLVVVLNRALSVTQVSCGDEALHSLSFKHLNKLEHLVHILAGICHEDLSWELGLINAKIYLLCLNRDLSRVFLISCKISVFECTFNKVIKLKQIIRLERTDKELNYSLNIINVSINVDPADRARQLLYVVACRNLVKVRLKIVR